MSKTLLSAPLATLEQGDDFIRRHLGPCANELPAMLAAVDSVMNRGGGVIEAPLLAKDGHQIFFSLNGVRFDTQGKSYLMGVGTDITEHRRTQEALRVSEEWHRLLAESVSDVIWTMDLTGRLTYVSPSIVKLRGFTVEEVVQQSMEDYLTPESLQVARTELGRFMADIVAGLRPPDVRCELEQYCKDGSTVWTEITASVMQPATFEVRGHTGRNRVGGYAGNGRARKEIEKCT